MAIVAGGPIPKLRLNGVPVTFSSFNLSHRELDISHAGSAFAQYVPTRPCLELALDIRGVSSWIGRRFILEMDAIGTYEVYVSGWVRIAPYQAEVRFELSGPPLIKHPWLKRCSQSDRFDLLFLGKCADWSAERGRVKTEAKLRAEIERIRGILSFKPDNSAIE